MPFILNPLTPNKSKKEIINTFLHNKTILNNLNIGLNNEDYEKIKQFDILYEIRDIYLHKLNNLFIQSYSNINNTTTFFYLAMKDRKCYNKINSLYKCYISRYYHTLNIEMFKRKCEKILRDFKGDRERCLT